MGYGYYYYGYYFQYLLFMLPAIILVLWAQGLVKSRYRKYSRVNTTFRVTGREVAERILCANGINDVGIARECTIPLPLPPWGLQLMRRVTPFSTQSDTFP